MTWTPEQWLGLRKIREDWERRVPVLGIPGWGIIKDGIGLTPRTSWRQRIR